MCGIAGVWNIASREKIKKDVLIKMCKTMTHRGPDEEGYYISEDGLGFGHRRLNIIDLSTGQQPLSNEDGTVWVVFNGEIYSFLEVREELVAKGHIFKTKSDTEVIVHAYEEYGEDCLEYFRGMFAFAIWDTKKQEVFLARDRAGQKPLYYYVDNERLIFASEMKAILAAGLIKKEIDKNALYDYFCLGYVPSPKTIFKEIKKLPPAHTLAVSRKEQNLKQYWKLNFNENEGKTEDFFREELKKVFYEAVKLRLISDVPLGAFLSGGVDSSSIVALMSEIGCDPLITNAIDFDVDSYNESKFAREIAERFQTEHHEFRVTASQVDNIERIIGYFDEPFADSSAIPTFFVSRETRKTVTVALSGDGGDENFAGYRRYYIDNLENEWRKKIGPLKCCARTLGAVYPQFAWMPQKVRGKTFLTNVGQNPIQAFWNSSSNLKNNFLEKVLRNDFKDSISGYSFLSEFEDYYNGIRSRDHLSKIQALDIRYYMCEDILTKVDRMSMANSLESRAPLLDHKLMELAASIPSNMKLKGNQGKYILKRTMESYFAPGFLDRQKQGFSMPVAEWLRKDLKTIIEERILKSKDIIGDCFKKKTLDNMWLLHQKGHKDYSSFFWTLLALQIWEDKYLT